MKKLRMLSKVLILVSMVTSLEVGFAQVVNDDCAGATAMGNLPTPGACNTLTGLQDGAPLTLTGQSTVGAVAENPYSYITACNGGGNMASPALDTWYSFVATGTIVNVSISGFPNASVGLWEGPCNNLAGRGCVILNAAGNGVLTVTQIIPGNTYYVQISGANDTQTDNNFTIAVDNDIDCDDCLRTSTLTASPAPVNGAYTPGQVVTFCYTVTAWEQENTNWFHGVQLAYGPGWTGVVSNPVPAATCQVGGGSWDYYPTGIGVVNAQNWGQGFYFDDDYDFFGNPAPDGDPTNNYGDDCSGTGLNWTFCFDLTVGPCAAGADLSVTINTSGDGESGNWTSNGCNDDDETTFAAYVVCCDPPLISITPPVCQGDANGQATAQGQGGQAPYDYVWENSVGTVLFTDNNNPGVSTLTGLSAGTYTVTVTDDLGCVQIVDITIADGPPCVGCIINSLNANIGSCLSGSVFDVTGDFVYTSNPGTGTLIVEVTNSSGTYTQTFVPPFVDGAVNNFNVTGIPADGSPLTVTVYFSDDLACTLSVSATSPAACNCAADIGTFSTATNGTQNGNDFVLCWDETVDFTSNGDWTAPAEAFSPPGPVYDPGISWLIYSCPPTLGLVPNTNPADAIENDPCLEFIVTGPNFNDFNDLYWVNQAIANGGSLPVNNTLYFMPITMYSISANTYSYVNTSLPCYEVGPIFSVQYLVDITEVSTEDCVAGTVSSTVSGGLPAMNGSNFTVQNVLPATATINTGTAPNNGTVVVGGLQDGDVYSFDIVDGNGCSITVSGTFVGLEDPSFSYPQSNYCANSANPTPTITGDPGGTFSSTAGLSINASTGTINIAASTPGSYVVTYTTPDPVCFASSTFNITINPLPIVDGNDETICNGDPVILNGTGAVSYVWNNGVTNGVAFNPSSTTTYTVTGTDANGCVGTGTAVVTVNPNPTPVITGPSTYCTGSFSTLSTTVAYTTYSWTTGDMTPTTDVTAADNPISVTVTDANGCSGTSATFTVTELTSTTHNSAEEICQGESILIHGNLETTAGVYTQTFPLPGGCDSTSNVTLTVNPLPVVDAGQDQTECDGVLTTLNGAGATTLSWDNGVTDGVAFQQAVGTVMYTLTGTDANGCQNTDQVTITINPLPTVNAGPDQAVCSGVSVTLIGSGAPNLSWNNGVVDGVPFNSPIGTTTYTLTGTDANGCSATDQVDVIVYPLPIVSAGNDITICEGTVVALSGSGAASYSWSNGVVDSSPFIPTTTQTYTVTGTDVNGCQNVDDVTVTVEPIPDVSFAGNILSGCAPLTVTFTNTTVGNLVDCEWIFSNGTTLTGCGQVTTTFTNAGLYDVTLNITTANGCTSSTTYTDYIYVEDYPNASFIPSATVVDNLSTLINFTNTSTGATSYLWNFGDNTGGTVQPSPSHQFPGETSGSYLVQLIAYSPMGCPDTAYATITVNEEVIFYVPNAFTPDSDDFNETFQPVFSSGFDPFDYTLLIFDRWGEILFESHNAEIGWNGTYGGKLMQDGTYTWKIEFKTLSSDERRVVHGHVNLLK